MAFVGTEIFLDTSEFEELIQQDSLLTSSQLTEIANRAVLFIVERTAEGRDAFGNRFARYSESYRRFRRRRGRSVRPDLSFDGTMMGSLTGGFDNGAALVFFANRAQALIADFHTSDEPRSVMPKRDFLDIDPDGEEHEVLAEMAANFIAQRLES